MISRGRFDTLALFHRYPHNVYHLSEVETNEIGQFIATLYDGICEPDFDARFRNALTPTMRLYAAVHHYTYSDLYDDCYFGDPDAMAECYKQIQKSIPIMEIWLLHSNDEYTINIGKPDAPDRLLTFAGYIYMTRHNALRLTGHKKYNQHTRSKAIGYMVSSVMQLNDPDFDPVVFRPINQ